MGHRIRETREARGFTVAEVARKVELDPASLSNIELGHRPASIEKLTRIAAELGVRLIDIVRPGTPLHEALTRNGDGAPL